MPVAQVRVEGTSRNVVCGGRSTSTDRPSGVASDRTADASAPASGAVAFCQMDICSRDQSSVWPSVSSVDSISRAAA